MSFVDESGRLSTFDEYLRGKGRKRKDFFTQSSFLRRLGFLFLVKEAGKERWDVRLIANYTGDERVVDFSTFPYPVVEKAGFTVVSLKGSYRSIKNLGITISIENLLDRSYEYVLELSYAEKDI